MATDIVSSEYCFPNSIKLTIDADKGVTYLNNGVIFRFEEPSVTLHDRRVLHDVSGRPVLTLYRKIVSAHGRWQVFKHDSTDSKNLLFAVRRPKVSTPKKKNINLEVFLAKNTKERVFYFKINACASQKSCDICAHGSPTILAKMTNKVEVEVQPNVDCAFIVALIAIVHQINHFGIDASKGKGNPISGICLAMNAVADATGLVTDNMPDN